MDRPIRKEAGSIGQVERLSYLYKEYERLHEVIESYSQSAFDDVKLLAVLGLVFAWDPIVSLVKTPHVASAPEILLIGFVIIVVASAIIAIRNLLKQSLLVYNLSQLDAYERQLRVLLDQDDKKTFRWVERWVQWFRMHHVHIACAFYVLYSLAVPMFSAMVLYWRTTLPYVILYIAIAIGVSVFPLWAAYSLYKRISVVLENPMKDKQA